MTESVNTLSMFMVIIMMFSTGILVTLTYLDIWYLNLGSWSIYSICMFSNFALYFFSQYCEFVSLLNVPLWCIDTIHVSGMILIWYDNTVILKMYQIWYVKIPMNKIKIVNHCHHFCCQIGIKRTFKFVIYALMMHRYNTCIKYKTYPICQYN